MEKKKPKRESPRETIFRQKRPPAGGIPLVLLFFSRDPLRRYLFISIVYGRARAAASSFLL